MSLAPSLAVTTPPENILNKPSSKPLIMLGGGGHARVLQETLSEQGLVLAGYIAPTAHPTQLIDVPWLGDDAHLKAIDPGAVELINGIGSAQVPHLRRSLYLAAKAGRFQFRTVIDSSAKIKASARVGQGAQVLVGAIIGSGVVLGEDVIVNSGAVVDHDSIVEAHSHISPGAALAGNVRIGEGSHVGLGSRVIQGVRICSNCIVGAGAVVIRDVPESSMALGVPAVYRRID